MVLRLADIAYEPLHPIVKEFLDTFAPTSTPDSISHRTAAVLDGENGSIYYRYDTKHEVTGEIVIAEVIPPLLHGIQVLNLNVALQGAVDYTDEISPTRPLADTLRHMKFDITPSIEDMQNNPLISALEPDPAELDHLQDH